jgi:integrase
MAWLENRKGRFRVSFRYGGKMYHHELKTENEKEAQALIGRVEENLILLERGKLEPPTDGELGLFLISDGKINSKPKIAESLPLSTFFRRYAQEFTKGAKESNTRYTETIHIKHLERIIGARTGIRSITLETLQEYVEERSKEKGRNGEVLSHTTIQKEIGTFGSIWNKWGVQKGLVAGPAPTKGLVYSKSKSKHPFQTWKQIEQRIKRGGLSERDQADLWDSLFLSVSEIDELLTFVKKNSRFAFIYPMFVFAAHTGARRSEILRSQIDDFDFSGGFVRIGEKKKDRSRELTYRHVPLSPLLRTVMKEFFDKHPGGQLVVCGEAKIPLTAQMAAHHFVWAVAGGKWDKLHGWHTLRHSFISNCAARGVDQRSIDAWVGHATDAMRQRYRHLFPDEQQRELNLVFG